MGAETVMINTPDGAFSAYIAHPQVSPAPAIVVIQEIFGVNAFIRETCDKLAANGYLAIAPDLFWRIGEIDPDRSFRSGLEAGVQALQRL